MTLCSSLVLSGMLFSEKLKLSKFCGKSNTFFDSEHIELSLDEELKVLCVLRLAQNGHNVVARVLLGEAVELEIVALALFAVEHFTSGSL